MTNQNLPVPAPKLDLQSLLNDLTIETADGQTVSLAPGQSVLDFLPTGGESNLPLYRLKVTQGHRDANLPGKPDTLYLTRKVGRDETARVEVVELGSETHVWPLMVHANRAYFAAKYDPNNPADPDCRSEDFVRPDPNIAQPQNRVCARLGQNGLVEECPLAKWGAKDPVTGKSTPPACTAQYILFFAVSATIDGEERMVVAEGYFKSASGTAGKRLVQSIRALLSQGKPAFTYPVRLYAAPAGVGTTILPEVMYSAPFSDGNDPETMAAFTDATRRAEDAIKYRLERSRTMPEVQAPELPNRPEQGQPEVVTQAAPSQPAAPTKNGNGKAKTAEPLV